MNGTAVAGIDRWKGGWVIAEVSDSGLQLSTAAKIGDACSRLSDHRAVAIDMPIALTDSGRREAEAEVRAVLGSSARSVFTSPTRVAVNATSQAEATELNRRQGGPGISAQSFGLFASIRELRSHLSGRQFDHWWETHPETAFALMNNGEPLAPKRTARGVAQRLAQLRCHYAAVDKVLLSAPAKVPIDDVLDAIAAVWSAQRIATDQATVYGPERRDDEGFAMGIRV